jgi:hypothetical protein
VTGFCLRIQVKPTQSAPVDRGTLRLRKKQNTLPEALCLHKNRMINNVQENVIVMVYVILSILLLLHLWVPEPKQNLSI